jgi:hypothetical protein
MQDIMQFIGIANIGPSLLLHLGDGCWIKRPDFFEYRRGQHAPHFNSPRAALFQRCII